MAGFVENGKIFNKKEGFKLSSALRDLSSLGMNYNDMVLRNSQAVGVAESKMANTYPMHGDPNDDMWYAFATLSMMDTNMRKNLSFFNKQYKTKRAELREFAMQDEIEDILDTLTDECIIYDDKNFFARPLLLNDAFIDDKIKDKIISNYNNLYLYFSMNDGRTAWNYFRKWLIDGYIAFEIIYNDKQDEIIGFKEIDTVTLQPGICKKTNKQIWIQNPGQANLERVLYDSQIIYISYSSVNSTTRESYVERLVRSFNLLRIMEHTRVIWAVMNASYRMKFIIPVGGKSKTRAKQSLGQLMHNYREVVDFDYSSGQLVTNGKPMMSFNKEYWLPSKDGESPEIETLGGEGPDLSDTDALKYFFDKLKMASKIPWSRFDKDSPASYEMAAEGVMRDEIKFSNFVNRLRSIFAEIIVKPLYIQTILDFPELAGDINFKANLTIKYNKFNVFDEMMNIEITGKRIDFIQNMVTNMVEKDEDMNEIPYWDLDFLINKWGGFSAEDLKTNEVYKEIKKLVKEGYSKYDAKKIVSGEPKSNFKKKKQDISSDVNSTEDSTDSLDNLDFKV